MAEPDTPRIPTSPTNLKNSRRESEQNSTIPRRSGQRKPLSERTNNLEGRQRLQGRQRLSPERRKKGRTSRRIQRRKILRLLKQNKSIVQNVNKIKRNSKIEDKETVKENELGIINKENEILNIYKQSLIKTKQIYEKRTENYCLNNHGITVDTNKPTWKNIREKIGNMTLKEYHSYNNNMACHDLTTTNRAPKTAPRLLGLGAGFCLQYKNIKKKDVSESLARFEEDIRTRYFVRELYGESDDEPPKLYLKNPDWVPPRAIGPLEDVLKAFKNRILREFNKRRWNTGSNLTFIQNNILKYLRNHPEYQILLADKNLGPCIMNREEYIDQVLKQHLSNNNCYEYISKETAEEYMSSAVSEFMDFINEPGQKLIDEHTIYLQRALKINKRIPVFYCMPKVHKNKIPYPLRPVVAQIGSPYHAISKIIDSYLQELLPSVESYIKDSDDLLKELRNFGQVDDDMFITTADAVAMYPNIDNDEALF